MIQLDVVRVSVGKAKNKDAEIRSQLLNEKQNEISPRLRSADSIKLAYGHKPNTVTVLILSTRCLR